MTEPSLWSFIADADMVVKLVMLILFAASVASWTIIFQRQKLFKFMTNAAATFQRRFWSGTNLNQLAHDISDKHPGVAAIFQAGFSEFTRLRQNPNLKPDDIMQGVERAMRIAQGREIEALEKHLSFLATVGSTSPYVGLFGTVWGIMTSFRALGAVQQASIAMVAPGISEALIATAIGLFAAIPAVIAYNRFSNALAQIENSYHLFQDELLSILQRQV